MPRSLRAQKNDVKTPTKPNCRLHGTEMVFDPATMRWSCTQTGCGIVAYPKQDDQGRPITGKGELEFVRFTDEDGFVHIFLRAVDNNVMLDVTMYMDTPGFKSSYSGPGKLFYTAPIVTTRITELDNYGRKKQ